VNWHAIVRRHARAAGVELATDTIDELAAHLEDLYLAAIERGADRRAAHREALQALERSGVLPLAHEPRPDRQATWRGHDVIPTSHSRRASMVYAFRTALRQFRLHPLFAALSILILGLASGSAIVVYTIVDAVVLRPLPYAAPDRLVRFWDTNVQKGLRRDPFSPVTFLDYQALPVFSGAAAWWRPDVNLVDPGLEPARVTTIETSGNLFEVLGVGPQLGPGFPAGGPIFSTDLVAVISDRLWRNRYAADPRILGRLLTLNGLAYRVVGVMPPGFRFPDDVDVWQRLNWPLARHDRQAHFMEGVARLADGVTLEQAREAADTLAARLGERFAVSNQGWAFAVIPLLEDQLGYYRPGLYVLFGAVGLLFLVGCLNVGSLLLTRGLLREKEIAVRSALGATPRQIITQLFAESLALSAFGAAAGLAIAVIALPLIVATTPVEVPRLAEAAISWRVLAATFGLVIAMTTVFGLGLALLLVRRRVATDLRLGERGNSRGVRRVYQGLVIAEVALSCALLVSAALLVRTVDRLTHVSLGVQANDVTLASIQIAAASSAEAAWRTVGTQHTAILDRLRQQPGILAAGAANFLPMEHGWRGPVVRADRAHLPQDQAPQAQHHSVSDGYLETMGATLRDGRFFTAQDTVDSESVAILNQTAADRYFPGQSAVGQEIRTSMFQVGPLGRNLMWRVLPDRRAVQPRTRVVGVVADVQNVALGLPSEPAVFYPMRQFPFSAVTLAVSAGDTGTAVRAVREAVRSVSPDTPIGIVDTWGARFKARTAEPRLLMTMLSVFSGTAALLAVVGVYGLFAWSVATRRRELAIRLTLGARPIGVGASLLRHSALLLALGLAGGWILVRAADQALAKVLFGIRPDDATSMLVGGTLLFVAALVASVPPAYHAMRVNPVEGLKTE
jgi:predicted permease